MKRMDSQIVVIGGGLAGLAAAHRLRGAGLRVVVVERAPVVGGRARTDQVGGYQIELGAEFLASFYTRTLALITELGLSSELQRIPRSSAILRSGRFYELWPNARAAFTPLLDLRQKLRLSHLVGSLLRHALQLDPQAIQKAFLVDDRSVSSYARTHLSEELLEYLLQPAISGIFYWTPEHTSRAIMLIALRAGLSRPLGLQLLTLREGLGRLGRALAERLDVRAPAEVVEVHRTPGGGYQIRARAGTAELSLQADGLVVATTASEVPKLLPWLDAERQAFFRAVRYSSTVNLAVGVQGQLPRQLYGLLFPRRETPFLASATVQSVKGASFAPDGHDLICLHLSGPATLALQQYDDATLSRLMLSDLRRLAPNYDPTPTLQMQRLYRCHEALPEFDVGSFQRLARFARGAIEPDRLVFAGDYLGGPFVEGAVTSGQQAAERLLTQLGP